jgi:uncharacterized membrane protein YeiH
MSGSVRIADLGLASQVCQKGPLSELEGFVHGGATFGGIVRDILGGESPVILSREIYVSAALGGAAIFVALALAGIVREYALAGSFWAAFAIRAAALGWDWFLPRYRPRPGRTRGEIDLR